jgi:regulator of replication initiation timing
MAVAMAPEMVEVEDAEAGDNLKRKEVNTMKRKALLIFAIISLLLVLALVPMMGCDTKSVGGSNPGSSSSSDTTSWEPRVKSLETRMGTAEGELETIPDDINIYTLVTDLQDQIDALIAENAALSDELVVLQLRLDAFEQEEEEEAEEEEPPLSGEVTAAIITQDEQPPIFTSGVTATNQTFPVKITNGTDEYQKVTFSIILRCISTDYKATVDAGFTMAIGSMFLTATPVPGLTDCQMIYFMWTTTDSIPVAPGDDVSIYVILNTFTTTSGWEIWEVVLGDITAKPL